MNSSEVLAQAIESNTQAAASNAEQKRRQDRFWRRLAIVGAVFVLMFVIDQVQLRATTGAIRETQVSNTKITKRTNANTAATLEILKIARNVTSPATVAASKAQTQALVAQIVNEIGARVDSSNCAALHDLVDQLIAATVITSSAVHIACSPTTTTTVK